MRITTRVIGCLRTTCSSVYSFSKKLSIFFNTLLGFLFLIVPAFAATSPVGSTAGSFRVSESGAATYSVPISTPPGTAGMKPSLSLNYSSQGGNGILGMGWSLGGLSAIHRCPKTLVQDGVVGGVNFDTNDRFCLDGQRLVAITGAYGAPNTEYRTESESYSRIISYGTTGTGPTSFKVWTKGGQIMEYGNTTDSRFQPQGQATAMLWNLNKVSDTVGNYLAITYTQDQPNGQFYPTRIDYAGNSNTGKAPNNSVQFTYETRPDITPMYHAAALMKTTVRMTKVQSYTGTTLTKEYRLAYNQSTATQRSRVATLTECAGDGVCLPALTFNWQDNAVGSFISSGDWASGSSTLYSTDARLVDVNGDGKADLILQYDANGTRYWEVRLSTGTGFDAGTVWASTNFSGTTIAGIGDVNGDGKADLILQYDSGSTRYWKALLSTGTSFVDGGMAWGMMGSTSAIVIGVADLNGDGLADMVVQVDVGTTRYWQGYLSTGTSFNGNGDWWASTSPTSVGALLADVNGDGKADLVIQYYTSANNWMNYGALLSTGTSFNAMGPWWWQTGYGSGFTWVGASDVNGDGLADLVIQYTQDGSRYFKALVSTGAAYVDTPTKWAGLDVSSSRTLAGAADVTGGGGADITLQYDFGGTLYWQNLTKNSDGSAAITNWSQITPDTAKVIGFSDINGDGRADLLIQYDNGGTRYWQARLSAGVTPDLLSSITNGLNATTSITYKPLTDNSVYTKGSGAVYPYLDVQGPIYVVSHVTNSDGIGGNYAMDYTYTGAKSHLQGGGFLGFKQVTTHDPQAGIRTTTVFRQDYPYQGMPLTTQKVTDSLVPLSQSNNTYTDTILNPTLSPVYHQSLLTMSIDTSYELNGSLVTTVTSTSQYDSYGNPTQIVVSTGDGYSKTTNSTYDNIINSNHWFLGRLRRSTVTSVTP